jgi:hypothetical protein
VLARLTVLGAIVLVAACRSPLRCERLLVGGLVHRGGGVERCGIAITAGRIIALPSAEEVAGWRSGTGEVVDLGGAHVFTGFSEGHGHLAGYGAALEQVDLHGAESFAAVVELARRAAAGLPAGSWVRGRGWDQNRWPGAEFPVHQALSAAVPDHPALLRRVDGHAVLTNARGLAAAGITAVTPDPPGGRIIRDGGGRPTGVLVDAAVDLLERVVPPPSAADIERHVLLACRRLAEFGITEIHDAGTGRETLAVLRGLVRDGRLPLRVYAMLDGADDELLSSELAAGARIDRGGMLAVRAVKLYADGALGSRGAWLTEPYSDEPSSRGLSVTPAAVLALRVHRIAAAGFQPAIHAIGDRAVTAVLDIYEHERALLAGLRPRIEHAQVVRPEDVPRFASLGVVAAVQPTHCTSDMPWAPVRLGPDRIAWAYRWRSLLAAGAHLELGSDVPVESPDPRLGVFAAITRRTTAGTPPDGWNRAEALSAAEAVEGYTNWVAYAAFEEDWRGAIAPGFAADLTVFDRDLEAVDPASVLAAHVLRTVVAGRDVYVAGTSR